MLRRSLQQATLRLVRRAPPLLAHAVPSAVSSTSVAVPSAAASLSATSRPLIAAARASFSTHAPRHIRRFTPVAAAHTASSNKLHSNLNACDRSTTILFTAAPPSSVTLQRRSKHSKAQPAAPSPLDAAAATAHQPASSTPAAVVDSAATRPVSGHNVPSFLRPSSATSAASAASAAEVAPASADASTSGSSTAPIGSTNASTTTPIAVSAAAATVPVAGAATAAPASAVDPATGAVGNSATAAPHTAVPTFLRPAPAAPIPILLRLQRHRWYKYWPNIGYLISVTGLLVTDILWLRSIIIVANIFGIAVHYSFSPPFWTGIYWSCFFILANLVHIGLILYDRRAVHLSDEEQRAYDATFAAVFSPQEFRKLLSQGEWHDLPPGTPLMQQGEEIEAVHWVSAGVCVVEQEKLTPLSAEEAEARGRRAAAGSGDQAPRVQQRRINGQPMLVSILDPPLPGSALALPSSSSAASSSGSSAQLGGGVNLPAEGPPSIGKSLLRSVLQGGLSWMDRVRVVPGPSRGRGGQDDSAGAPAPTPVPVTAHSDAHHVCPIAHPPAHTDTTEVSQAPAPLPSSHIHLHLPHAHDAAGHAHSASSAPTAATAAAAPSSSAPVTVVQDHPSLPEAIILPSASSALQQPHAAPHAHHLLNVHVDSTDANSPTAAGAASSDAADADDSASVSADRDRARNRDREREVLPVNSGLGDGFGFDMLHESASRKPSSSSSSSAAASSSSSSGGSSSSAALDDDDDLHELSSDLVDEEQLDPMDKQEQLQSTRRALEASLGAQPLDGRITHEHVLARWRDDRESRRVARMKEKEARVAQRAALAEQKRLRGLSALERQFGQTATAAATAAASDKTTDALAAASAPSSASTAAASSASAIVPASASSSSSANPALPLPAFERHSSVVGYVRAGRLIGEMCLVSPSSAPADLCLPDAASPGAVVVAPANSYAIAPVSVTTAAPTRVLSWDRRALQRLFFVLPSLAVGWYSVVSTDLVNRLHAQRASAAGASYTHLITGVLSDGTVSERQRALLAAYRAEHDIGPEMHARALQQLGWSAQDFERGSQQRGWMEALLGAAAGASGGGNKAAARGAGPPASSSA